MGTTPINDAYREALGFSRRDVCALVAVVSAWTSLGRGVSPAEVDRFVEEQDPSGIAYVSKALPGLERLGLVMSPAKPFTNRRPYQPTPRGLRMVRGWVGRELAA